MNVKRFGSRSGLTFLVLIWGQNVCIGYQQITLKAPRRNASNFLTNLSIEANRVDPDQTAPIGAV